MEMSEQHWGNMGFLTDFNGEVQLGTVVWNMNGLFSISYMG
jgi:hypothetical protein